MVKRLIVLFFLLFPALCNAEYYMGIARTYNVLHFDIEREVDSAIDDSGYRLHVEGLQALGYPLILIQDFEDHNVKFTLGKEINNTWSIEYTYENLGKYTSEASIHFPGTITLADYSTDFDLYAEAFASLEAEAHSISYSVGDIPV